ncbi:hypothetical protein DSO57_1016202 [Entomophthora muscae]|uniref:Uncharacterized protein n=1 Tax=Entomophthora muscae TaxID=34485 RepID=A0ACC2UQ87_9FUNG|nr:hypothetical protein DSO57_1016202 [Entomophthora muscae]
MAGLPVGVQVLGRSFEDEKVLAVMKVIEALQTREKVQTSKPYVTYSCTIYPYTFVPP